MPDWYFGELDFASAHLAGNVLVVRAEGVLPAPCFDVKLGTYAPGPGGAAGVQLGLYWRAHRGPCPSRPTPFAVQERVDVRGARPPAVRIYHADGYADLQVRAGFPSGARWPPLRHP